MYNEKTATILHCKATRSSFLAAETENERRASLESLPFPNLRKPAVTVKKKQVFTPFPLFDWALGYHCFRGVLCKVLASTSSEGHASALYYIDWNPRLEQPWGGGSQDAAATPGHPHPLPGGRPRGPLPQVPGLRGPRNLPRGPSHPRHVGIQGSSRYKSWLSSSVCVVLVVSCVIAGRRYSLYSLSAMWVVTIELSPCPVALNKTAFADITRVWSVH